MSKQLLSLPWRWALLALFAFAGGCLPPPPAVLPAASENDTLPEDEATDFTFDLEEGWGQLDIPSDPQDPPSGGFQFPTQSDDAGTFEDWDTAPADDAGAMDDATDDDGPPPTDPAEAHDGAIEDAAHDGADPPMDAGDDAPDDAPADDAADAPADDAAGDGNLEPAEVDDAADDATAADDQVAMVDPPAGAAARRPNVVFIITDDQRWDMLGCMGHPFLETPHLDRIAAEGALCLNAFVTTSICSPSRASMLSGLYAHAHGVTNNFTDYPPGLVSFPMRLQAEGYATAYIGKWHMDEKNDDPRPGFDYWASHKGQGKYFDTEFNVNGERQVLEGYYTTRVTDLAIDWLRGQKERERPFLLMLGHKAPHSPNEVEPKYEGLYDDVEIKYPDSAFQLEGKPDWIRERLVTWHGIYGPLWGFRKDFPDESPEGVAAFAAFVRAYVATIKSIDDQTGRLYEALKEIGALDNTLLIFVGDNGFFLGEHGMMDKRAMHEASIRVPLLVRYPPLVKPGTKIEQQVLNYDLAPTVLDLCGAPPLENIHGRSMRPLFEGNAADWRTSWYYAYNYEKQFPYTPNVRGVRTDEWKYVHYPHGDGGPDRHKAELYHLKTDPEELKNLIDDPQHAEKVAELREELTRLMKEAGALPDKMPLDEGVKTELPEASIR